VLRVVPSGTAPQIRHFATALFRLEMFHRRKGSRGAYYRSLVRSIPLAPRVQPRTPEGAVSFGIYLIGYVILIVGLALGAHLLHVPANWIGIGVLVMIGIGIITGVTSTRRPDPS
jgi:hypothetical protein